MLRLDGFVSVRAGYRGGEFVTHPLVFDGQRLVMNFSTSAVGSVQVEVQDANGTAKEVLENICKKFNDNMPKNFVQRVKKLYESGERDTKPGAIDSWFDTTGS